MKYKIILFGIFFLLYYLALPVHSDILIVYRKNISLYQEILDEINKKINTNIITCAIDNNCQLKNRKFDLVVALGNKCSSYALDTIKTNKTILSFFITDYSLPNKCLNKNCIYFYLFPPFKDFIRKTKEILNDSYKIGIIYTENSKPWIENFSYKDKNLNIFFEKISSSEIFDDLRHIFCKNYDIYILAPDYIFLQNRVIKHIIKLSYITKKPVIGFAEQMINYGFPIVISYSAKKIKCCIAKIINQYLSERKISKKHIKVSVLYNQKALNIFSIPLKNIK